MNKLLRILVSVIILFAVASFSYLSGELVGMKSGYAHTLKLTSPMDAAYTVSVIRMIEGEMDNEAIEMLETKLDNYIISHWTASQCRLVGLNPFIKEEKNIDLFYSTIAYRKANPTNNRIATKHLKEIENEI